MAQRTDPIILAVLGLVRVLVNLGLGTALVYLGESHLSAERTDPRAAWAFASPLFFSMAFMYAGLVTFALFKKEGDIIGGVRLTRRPGRLRAHFGFGGAFAVWVATTNLVAVVVSIVGAAIGFFEVLPLSAASLVLAIALGPTLGLLGGVAKWTQAEVSGDHLTIDLAARRLALPRGQGEVEFAGILGTQVEQSPESLGTSGKASPGFLILERSTRDGTRHKNLIAKFVNDESAREFAAWLEQQVRAAPAP